MITRPALRTGLHPFILSEPMLRISRQRRSDLVFASFAPVWWRAIVSRAGRMVDVNIALARFTGGRPLNRNNWRRRVMAEANTSSAPSHPLIESDHIEGTAVYDANGKQIGTIKRLVIEKVSGHVVYAVTSFGGLLGLGSETHTIPWEQLHYDTALGGYKASVSEPQLRNAPEFSRQDESLLSGHEREALINYYAVPPGQL